MEDFLWSLRRAWRAVLGWSRDVRYGIENLWRFRREIWTFRPWDWSYNHRLLMRSLEITQANIERNKNHTTWAESVAEIQAARDTFREFEEGDHKNWAEENAAWERHWIALGKLRNWWD